MSHTHTDTHTRTHTHVISEDSNGQKKLCEHLQFEELGWWGRVEWTEVLADRIPLLLHLTVVLTEYAGFIFHYRNALREKNKIENESHHIISQLME